MWAFTCTELSAVVALLALGTAVFVRAQVNADNRPLRERVRCIANLKQIGFAFRMWSNEHDDKFPMQYGADKEGTREAIEKEETWRHFAALSNELSNPKILTCASDDRVRATNFVELAATNISYFVGLDADEMIPQMILSGDRNVTNGIPAKKGVMELADKAPAGWTGKIHRDSGNLVLADGSAQQTTTPSLRRQINTANASNHLGITRVQLP